MEFLTVVRFIQYGTPGILLMLMFLNMYQLLTIRRVVEDMKELKKSITWGETCGERHKEIDRRLDKLEDKVF